MILHVPIYGTRDPCSNIRVRRRRLDDTVPAVIRVGLSFGTVDYSLAAFATIGIADAAIRRV